MTGDNSTTSRSIGRRANPAPYSQAPGLVAPESGETAPSDEVARYIADMTIQLASMASSAKLDLLAYFLKMAHAESIAVTRQPATDSVDEAPPAPASPEG
jgi:hypothetical protein